MEVGGGMDPSGGDPAKIEILLEACDRIEGAAMKFRDPEEREYRAGMRDAVAVLHGWMRGMGWGGR
jgi:hypothetical protein